MLIIRMASEESGIYFDQEISRGAVIGLGVFILLLYVAFYLLRSFGLYKIAKNRDIDKAYLAFIPGVWMYTACKIIGDTNLFGINAGKAAVWLCVVFSCAVYLPIISAFLQYFPYVMYVLQGGHLELLSDSTGVTLKALNGLENHFDTKGINLIITIISYLNIFLSIAEIFITVTVYIELFKKYWPEHYILGAVLSFFRFFPIVIFAVRNRQAVDYNEYFRQRYYGAGYTPYGGPSQGDNGNRTFYGNQNNGYGSAPDNDPFDEFSNKPEEPFGEFKDDNKSNGDSGKDDFFN